MAHQHAADREWRRVLKTMPPLHQAAWHGENDRILAALRKGVDVNASDAQGYSALTWAAAEGHVDTVRLLLDQGADPNGAGPSGSTALMTAATFGHGEIVRLLLEHGADPNRRGFRAKTALLRVHCAAGVPSSVREERLRQVTLALVEAGADVNAADEQGQTPLMHFVSLNCPDLVRLLVEHGATATNYAGVPLVVSPDASAAEQWNSHWARALEDPFRRGEAHLGIGTNFLESRLDLLRRRGIRSILLPGNGCSLLPHALVHVGFRVTIVDLSAFANEVVAAASPTPELLGHYLPEYRERCERGIGTVWVRDPEASLQRVAREALPGGSLTVSTADVLDWESPEEFDCIYDDRLAMLLPRERWPELASRYRRLLRPEGLCILETLNLGGGINPDAAHTRQEFEVAFTAAGFRVHPTFGETPGEIAGAAVLFSHGSG